MIYDTTIDSLRRFNEDVREVTAGFECGIVLTNFQDCRRATSWRPTRRGRSNASSPTDHPQQMLHNEHGGAAGTGAAAGNWRIG